MIGGFKFDNGPKVESYIKLLEHYKTLAHTHSLTHSQTQRRRRRIWRRWWLTWGRGEAGGEIGDSRLASFLTILQLLDSKFQIPDSSRFKRCAGILDSGFFFWAAIRRQPLEESWLLPCWALGNYRTSCPDCFMEESSHDRFPPPSSARKSFFWPYLSAWSGQVSWASKSLTIQRQKQINHLTLWHVTASFLIFFGTRAGSLCLADTSLLPSPRHSHGIARVGYIFRLKMKRCKKYDKISK